MWKKITLAAFFVLGATSVMGISAAPAAAENMRSVNHLEGLAFKHKVYHQRRGWRSIRFRPYHRPARFLNRVRQGRINCYRTIRRPHLHRHVQYGHGYYRSHGRRLGARAVGRLIRSGRGHALRCFTRYRVVRHHRFFQTTEKGYPNDR